MNSYERFMAAASLQQPDCVPVAPYMGNFGAALSGTPIGTYCRSGKVMADAQYQAWERLGQDAVVAQSDNYYIAEGFGLEVDYHDDGTPTVRRPLIQELRDIDGLTVPDPRSDGRMPVYLEAISRLAERLKRQVIIRAPGTGPFALAGHLLGTEELLMEIAMLQGSPDPEVESRLRRLLELTTEALIRFQKACIDAGADMVQAGDSSASLDLISPRIYEEWAFPYEKKFFDALNPYARQHSAVTLLHICGNMTKVLEREADTGAMLIELDSKVNLAEAKRRIGNRVCLIGNIEPSGVLLQGTPEVVRQACTNAIADAAEGGGFILGSGCEVPPFAPFENMATMVAAGHATHYAPAGSH